MKVVVIVGETARHLEVRSDLLVSGVMPKDAAQDAAASRVGAAFTEAYRAEHDRVVKGFVVPSDAPVLCEHNPCLTEPQCPNYLGAKK